MAGPGPALRISLPFPRGHPKPSASCLRDHLPYTWQLQGAAIS